MTRSYDMQYSVKYSCIAATITLHYIYMFFSFFWPVRGQPPAWLSCLNLNLEQVGLAGMMYDTGHRSVSDSAYLWQPDLTRLTSMNQKN